MEQNVHQTVPQLSPNFAPDCTSIFHPIVFQLSVNFSLTVFKLSLTELSNSPPGPHSSLNCTPTVWGICFKGCIPDIRPNIGFLFAEYHGSEKPLNKWCNLWINKPFSEPFQYVENNSEIASRIVGSIRYNLYKERGSSMNHFVCKWLYILQRINFTDVLIKSKIF